MKRDDIEKIWLTDSAVWVRTIDGREAKESFADYPRLKWATSEQRKNYEVETFGIHWPDLDEDLCYDGFFEKKPANRLYRIFIDHPELNASAIARRLGMAQSLFASYVSGAKKPSKEREDAIIAAIRSVGEELANLKLT